MQLVAYILVYPLLWLISILPFRLLYILSDIICLLIYRIIGYRKATVKNNLRLVFPEKSEKEISNITSKFYKHFCDLFLEMIKTLSISNKQLQKRFVIDTPETLKLLNNSSRSTILMYGHYASYEWSSVIQSHVSTQGLAIYKKLANPYFDKLVRDIRSKYKTELINSKKALFRIEELYKNNEARVIAFLSDQSPKLKPKNTWFEFMGINVPCFTGAELSAKKYNFPVVFLKIDKVKRGHYKAELVVLSEDPSKEEDLYISKKFNKLLEEQIKKAPEYYLWTHKRWKHKGKEDFFKS